MNFFVLFLADFAISSDSCGKCSGRSVVDPRLNWDDLGVDFGGDLKKFASDPAVVRECRLGIAELFYSLGKETSDLETRHNFNQFAMAMVWDVSRSERHCLDDYWLGTFMNDYLSLAKQLARHEQNEAHNGVDIPAAIGIATVCDYANPGHVLFDWLEKISRENRIQYASKHGYKLFFETVNKAPLGKSPVWSAISFVIDILKHHPELDYVMWMDCDALFVDQARRIESFLRPGFDLFISEDGRGLSGGNWVVRNSAWSLNLLESEILRNIQVFDLWDLKDQFALLWTLLRSSLNDVSDNFGYPPEVCLVSQGLLNAYPWALCRPSHHCFEDGVDFIVSFITLGSQSQAMAQQLVGGFHARN